MNLENIILDYEKTITLESGISCLLDVGHYYAYTYNMLDGSFCEAGIYIYSMSDRDRISAVYMLPISADRSRYTVTKFKISFEQFIIWGKSQDDIKDLGCIGFKYIYHDGYDNIDEWIARMNLLQ